MRKKYFIILVISYFICTPAFLFNAQFNDQKPPTILSAVALFDCETAAIGSNKSCFLIRNASQPEEAQQPVKLLAQPIYNLITNKKKRLLGVFCKNFFAVYNIDTLKKIWLKPIYSQHSLAAFSHTDDTIFLCDNKQLISNNKLSMKLPYTGSRTRLSIECHPTKNMLLHPCSNSTLREYSFVDKTAKLYKPIITGSDTIWRILYDSTGSCIAILTNNRRIYIYNPKSNTTIPVLNRENGTPYSQCQNFIFVPNSDMLAFSCLNQKMIYFWNFKCQTFQQVLVPLYDDSRIHSTVFVQHLDISDDGTRILSHVDDCAYMGETNSGVLKYRKEEWLFLRYTLLKTYADNTLFLPNDIMRLLVQLLKILYSL